MITTDAPVCPYCGYKTELCDSGTEDVTYWGSESGPVVRECGNCGKEYSYEEQVTRTWETMTLKEYMESD